MIDKTPRGTYIDISLLEFAYWYLRRKKIKPTTGNLFLVMQKLLHKIDYINKNTTQKKIEFTGYGCVLR